MHHINGNCTNIVFCDCNELKQLINCPYSVFYLPLKYNRQQNPFFFGSFLLILIQIHIFCGFECLLNFISNAIRAISVTSMIWKSRNGKQMNKIIGQKYNTIVVSCVVRWWWNKNAYGNKSCFELLLNICVNGAFYFKRFIVAKKFRSQFLLPHTAHILAVSKWTNASNS